MDLPQSAILAGFLSAITTFAQSEIGKGSLQEFKSAGMDVILDEVPDLFTAFLFVSKPTGKTKGQLSEFVKRFHSRFKIEIEKFQGQLVFHAADEWIEELFIF